MDKDNIDLGFLEVPENPRTLNRCYFPSKVGGKPAWLNPCILPNTESMLCPTCKDPLAFLLQIYAPNNERPHSFHRTIFVFCCKTGSCYASNDNNPFKIWRCNLPRLNDFYDYNPPDYVQSTTTLTNSDIPHLCVVCGCYGKKYCSRCKAVSYCGKKHQTIHWKKHKVKCCNEEVQVHECKETNNFLFPEFELVIEPEFESKTENNQSKEYDLLTATTSSEKYSSEELDKMCSNQKSDEAFLKFKEKLACEPEQVIRYKKKGSPLWCSQVSQPTEDIPPCRCGSKRSFEFQIMPHLLSHLEVDTAIEGPTIDWGTIAVYTCDSDCTAKNNTELPYIEEFSWKQSYSEDNQE